MACPSEHPDTDAASLTDSFVARIPAGRNQAAMHLRDAASDFFNRSHAWREQRLSLVLTAGQTRYAVPMPSPGGECAHVYAVWARDPDGHECELEEHREVHVIGHSQRWYSQSPREIVFHEPIDSTSEDNTVRLHIAVRPDSNNYCNPGLLDKYREAIISGASYYASLAQGQKTQDRQVATFHKGEYERQIEMAKREMRNVLSEQRPDMTRTRAARLTTNQRYNRRNRSRGYRY